MQYLYFLNTKFPASSYLQVAVQSGLFGTWSETQNVVFSWSGSYSVLFFIGAFFSCSSSSLYEPLCAKNQVCLFVQPQKTARAAWNVRFRKKIDCTSCVAKTKALISYAITAQLICFSVFRIIKKQIFSWHGLYRFAQTKYSGYSWKCASKCIKSLQEKN